MSTLLHVAGLAICGALLGWYIPESIARLTGRHKKSRVLALGIVALSAFGVFAFIRWPLP